MTRRLHVGFVAPSRAAVDEFWRVGVEAGYRDDGAPGPRPQYTEDYYGAFLLDPDGNSAEAVHHGALRRDGASTTSGCASRTWPPPSASTRRSRPMPGCGRLPTRPSASRSTPAAAGSRWSRGTPSENVHIAFPAADDATVDAFHAAALEAGYRDNGAPAERTHYHPGYYGAFVLDPDGNNVEVINHNYA